MPINSQNRIHTDIYRISFIGVADFQLVVDAVAVARQHMRRHTAAAAEKIVGHIVDSIGGRHCNRVERPLVQLRVVRRLEILVGILLLAIREADPLPFVRAVDDAGMASFLFLLVHPFSFHAMMHLHFVPFGLV